MKRSGATLRDFEMKRESECSSLASACTDALAGDQYGDRVYSGRHVTQIKSEKPVVRFDEFRNQLESLM